MERRKTRQVRVGDIIIGGDAPISVQSMTKTDTRDVKATVNQIRRLEEAGCDLIRVAVPDAEAAGVLGKIKKAIKIPLVADIHFDYRLALEAIRQGVDKLRINPGNIKNKEKVSQIVKAAKEKGVPIRVGVNAGSVDKSISDFGFRISDSKPSIRNSQSAIRNDETIRDPQSISISDLGFRISDSKSSIRNPQFAIRNDETIRNPQSAIRNPELLAASAINHLRILEELDFYDTVISVKATSVFETIETYQLLAKSLDYPFHIGITEAGTAGYGTVKSSVGIGSLLTQGLGDTLRVSLTADPAEEVKVGRAILKSLGLVNEPEIISCPTCGRCQIDLIRIAREVENRVEALGLTKPLKIAVMGCVVNGPGEAKEADIGLCGGKGIGVIFRRGESVRKVPEIEMVDALIDEVEKEMA
ncbi:MAG: flavodoxin-dependent (E)-4-hydroxy-3-methylbut-2-enyl-diphosphate synthase [bacterium]|nr:flavodoxin-dependent (E)-4-hydroxy-3-methylbut-2-enyl-diphosphate synthase [bacterium]